MSPSQSIWLDLSCADFLAAIKALKPPRMPKTHALKELQIGLVKGEAIFCMEGAQTRCPAIGEWNGFVCLPYGMLLPYLKLKPPGERVRLSLENDRLRIGANKLSATWIEVSPWIGEMALEAHFMSDGTPVVETNHLYCPKCGAKKGIRLGDFPQKAKPTTHEKKLFDLRDNSKATHACKSCLHAWVEFVT